jgi:hypothetical protein
VSSGDTKRVLEGAAPLVGQELSELVSSANDVVNQFAKDTGLAEKVEQSPYGMIAAALGVGYVVGGGLFTPTTSRLLGLATKLLSVPLVQNQLLNVAETAVDQFVSQSKKYTDK